MADPIRRYLAATSYESIAFPAVDLTTGWGNDRALHQGLLTPGADAQTTGRKPFSIHMRIAFVNDIIGWPKNLFPDRYQALMEKFRRVPLGTLVHPTYGPITSHVDDVQEHLDPKIGNGMFVDVAWTESTLPNQIFPRQTGSSGAVNIAPVDDTTAQADQTDALVAGLPASDLPKPVVTRPAIDTMLAILNAGVVSVLIANSAFNTALKLINGNINLAAEFGIDWHDYRAAAERCRAATYRYKDSYFSSRKPTLFRVPATMGLGRVAALVYGDPSQAFLLRLNNVIADETAIPANTILTVVQALS